MAHVDITGTANYATYQAAIVTAQGTPTRGNALIAAREQRLCIEQAGGNPGYLNSLPKT